MKRLKLLLVTVVMLPLTGCILCETIETRISLRGKDEPALAVTEYTNISSGEARLSDVQNDFDMLISDWQGDQYLLDRAEEGLFVKNRELSIRDGKISGRETGIIKNLDKHHTFWVNNDERIMLFEAIGREYELVETNGRIVRTGKNTIIVWPEDATELYWKQRYTGESESFYKDQPIMLKMFKEYLANQKKAAPGQ